MPEKVGQKIDHMGVSRDEFRRFLRKANIAYFAAKNDLLFRKLPSLVDLVRREGHFYFKKDIISLCINEDGCWEVISANGKVSIMIVVNVASKSNLYNILMDGSTISRFKLISIDILI